jgi:predicted dehydrogenase
MTNQPYQVAILGAGNISQMHYDGYRKAGAMVVAIADPVAAIRERRVREWGVTAYESVAECVQHPGLMAVSVCSPTAYHLEAVLAAAQAGLHVLCEKPLALDIAQMQQMIDSCAAEGVVLQTGHHLRSSFYMQKIQQLIETGALGTLTYLRLRQAHDWGGSKSISPNFATRERAGGGTLLDNGCHMMDMARFLGGEVASVFCQIATRGFDIEVEDVAQVSLRFASGLLGSLETAWTATGWENSVAVYGTLGSAHYVEQGAGVSFIQRSRNSGGTWAGVDETRTQLHADHPHTQEVGHFLASIGGEHPVICSGEDGRESVRLILAAYQSADTGVVVKL